MKTHLFTNRSVVPGLAAVAALASISLAQPGPPADRGRMGLRNQRMERHQSAIRQLKANDERLLSQVENLRSAITEAKIDLLVDIVSTLVKDRAEMHARMWDDPPLTPEEISSGERNQATAQESGAAASPAAN